MKLISINIETNKHYERIFPFLEKQKPDVICMQEVLEEDFEYIKERLGTEGIFKVHARATSSHSAYTHLKGKRFGVAIFSKTIVKSGYIFY